MYSAPVLWLKKQLRKIRRWLGWSPMNKVMQIIEAQGYTLEDCKVLEAFAGDGQMQVVDYVKKVAHVTAWEWGSEKVRALREQLPQVHTIQTDSYERIKTEEPGKYDIVILDASPKSENHWEVFDLFPAAFRMLAQSGVFVLTIAPERNSELLKHYPELDTEEHRRARAKFYDVPLDASDRISWFKIDRTFTKLASNAGLDLTWSIMLRRNAYFVYFVFTVSHKKSSHPDRMTKGNAA